MSDLLALADRVEKAEAGSRELDVEIFEAIGLTSLQERHCRDWCTQNGRTDLTRDRYISAWAQDFTRSLDAAMSLVPKGWDWELSWLNDGACANVGDPVVFRDCDGATPALALCAAALRALADTGSAT